MKANNSDNCLENVRDSGAFANKQANVRDSGAFANKQAVTMIFVATIGLKEENNFFQNLLVIKVYDNVMIWQNYW